MTGLSGNSEAASLESSQFPPLLALIFQLQNLSEPLARVTDTYPSAEPPWR